MMGACKLNNKSMRNLRKDTVYQCVIVDLYLMGVLEKDEAEELLGCGIPRGLSLPNGGRMVEEDEEEDTVDPAPEEPVTEGEEDVVQVADEE